MKKYFILFIINFIILTCLAQNDMSIAISYYKSNEYDKAELIFKKLYKQKKAKYYFDYYFSCLVKQEKYKEAERTVKKEIKLHSNDLTFYVDLGYLKKIEGNDAASLEHYNYVYKNLPNNRNSIIQISNTFYKHKEYEWAEKIYIKGNEFIENGFNMELANVYAAQRQFSKMISSYLDYGDADLSKLHILKSVFLSYMKHDVNEEFTNQLQRELLLRVQKKPNSLTEELLIWFYVTNSKFYNALMYAKAVDRRHNENGVRVYTIGEQSFDNEDYNTANKAFKYVVDKGASYPYFYKARSALLNVMYKQVTQGISYTEEQISDLERRYLSVIDERGISSETIDLIIDFAHLQTFYLNKKDEAIELLKKALDVNNLSDDFRSKLMLELADIYVFTELPWDAVLIYAKIEQDYIRLPITDDAKFKKAKTYFYLGDFQWAKDQWDILKGSPSKLIANDAIYWSHFISESIGEDSILTAMKKYARADLLYYQRNFELSLHTLDTIIKDFASDPIVPNCYFLKSKIFNDKKDYEQSAEMLEKIISDYSYVLFADKALFELAKLYDYKLNQKDKAIECYKKILFDFKGSLFTDPSRKRFRELKNI